MDPAKNRGKSPQDILLTFAWQAGSFAAKKYLSTAHKCRKCGHVWRKFRNPLQS